MGNSIMTMDDDAKTSTHEMTHYYQQMIQGWARYFGRGLYEQWWLATIRGKYPYGIEGTNEYNAEENQFRYRR